MAKRIQILDTHTANRIAAGEVVDRPASVVKELVENALDAGSKRIVIEAEGGGIDLIRVRDDGAGIAEGDIKTAFARHATSKIQNAEDLDCIETLGFRGEALASIAAVARVTVRSKEKAAETGTLLRINGGEIAECMPTGCIDGTLMQVENLFYNTPARLKFLKSARTEAAAISDFVSRMMLAHPEVAFELMQNGRTVYQSAGDGDLRAVLGEIYGKDALAHLKAVDYDDGYVALKGFAGTEQLARSNRLAQSFFINRRYIKSQKLSFAIQRAYDTRLMTGKFPLIALDISISNREIDVNVHPNKMEVRFKEEDRVTRAAHTAVKRALGMSDIPTMLQRDVSLCERETWQIPRAQENAETAEIAERKRNVSERLSEAAEAPRAVLREAAVQSTGQSIPHIEIPRRQDDRSAKHIAHDETEACDVPKKEAASLPETRACDAPQTTHVTAPAAPDKEEARQLCFADAPYTVVGQLFACYILVQQGEDAFFIDQHAAHERKLYEQMAQKGIKPASQMLLSPQIIKLSASEYEIMQENMESFRKIGFDVEEFGPLTISVRAVPYVLGAPQTLSYLHEVLDMLGKKNRCATEDVKRDTIIRQACRRAIKAGASLGETEIRALMDDYRQGGIPLTCPHGRPVMIRVSKTEMEKLFKRLV